MSSEESSFDLSQQLLAHLESLRAAGIMFAPRGPALELPKLSWRATELSSTPNLGQLEGTQSLLAPSPIPLPDSPEFRRQALTILASEISECNLCSELFSTRTQTVFGVGPLDPDVAFVGEAPGADEDRLGEPFVGKAGQLLNRIIGACGFTRKEVYIFNTLKCRPPNNRTPSPTECTNCRPYFERQFELVKPKHIVALGATAAKSLLQTGLGIGKLRGKVYQYGGRPLICTFHPSALLRDDSGAMKRDCWEDMKLLLQTMGRPIPDAKRG
jgi:uracil-DNA glycosylase